MSTVSVLIVGVALDVVVEILGVTRLFVSVCVSVVPTIAPVTEAYEVPQDDPVDNGMPDPG